MLPIEAVNIGSEIARPLTRRLVPRCVVDFLRGLGFTLGRWSAAAQARLPEPVVIGIKLLAAWTLLPLLGLAFCFAPGVAKVIVGIVVARAATRTRKRPGRKS